jgi:predicted phosphoadenosine phosphosulfate sulfurtransferase
MKRQNVYEAAVKRIELIFNEFENVLVAFSGGKDSGICLNLCYDYAKKNNLLHKLSVYHEDYEAGYQDTFDYIEREFDKMNDIKRYWFCLPIKAACSVSMHQTHWIPWNPSAKKIWVRDIPDKDYVFTTENINFKFDLGMSGFDFRIYFANEFAKQHGRTAVVIGSHQGEG